jgi:hypothetical protein
VSAGEFLRSVWPSTGIFCLATPRDTGGWRHWTFDTIDEVVAALPGLNRSIDVYFTVHTLKAKQVPHRDPVLAAKGKTQTRVQTNTAAARCFFFDLDVGEEDAKYDTQAEAITGLIAFCQATSLPRPTITSSGGGLHVYWPIGDPLDSSEWRDHATHLRQIALHYGLKIDVKRTTDTASVLRVVGTFNWKDPKNPRPVTLLTTGVPTPTGVFTKLLDDAIIKAGIEPKLAPKLLEAEGLGSNLQTVYDGPVPAPDAVLSACAQMQRLVNLKGKFSEPEWYHNVIGVGRFVEDGHRVIQSWSQGHGSYSPEATIAKIRQNEANQRGPTSCATVAYQSGVGDTLCVGCPFQGSVHGPIQAALFRDPAPAPVVELQLGAEIVTVEIPDPPEPYSRIKGGGIAVLAKDASGESSYQCIYDYDLFPVRRLSNPTLGIEQQLWHVGLPRSEEKDFTLDADMLYDTRKFAVAISNQGIYPNKGHLVHLQEYMVAYISQLQKLVDADAQCNHLGWSEEHDQFVLPDKILFENGTAKPAQLSVGAQRASATIGKRGDANLQARLMQFYNHPDYIPHQFFILAGLAAPLFYMTGHHGVIVNASGQAGASKSTSLYTAASFWGQPELYPINGTNNGATVRGRNERVTVLANLPICVDEITHMPTKDAVDLAMSITQPGHRIRLETTGTERANVGGYKATIMLATANNSLHGLLSSDNSQGTAGSMRVFEIIFKANGVHSKPEADDFLLQLRENFGHLGELFVTYVLKHRRDIEKRVRQVMREIDETAHISSAERFWSAVAAVVLVTAEIALALGLTPFSVEALKAWLINHQFPAMRGVVREEYSDPLSVIADYLSSANANIIVTNKTGQNNLTSVQHVPHTGAVLGHYDKSDQMLYVLKTGFKDYCARRGASALTIINDLHEPRGGARIVCQKHTRRTLGAGTEYAKAQTWCFAINMAHPDVSGVINLEVVQGGQGDSGRAGDRPELSIVT